MKKNEDLIHEELEYAPSFELPTAEVDNLHTAIIKVMDEVKSIDKSMTVGSGANSYKGVADKDVKYIIGQSMVKNGLTCVPIDVKPTTRIDRWEETSNYGAKQKQSIFVEVVVTYKMTYAKTNESIVIVGYGHGVDSQDKAAGKAMTYALKNALLYSFLVPTGAIDDTDKTHSDAIPTPPKQKPKFPQDRFENGLTKVGNGELTAEAFKKALEGFELTDLQTAAIKLI
jgi:hypothetical protein